MNWTACHRDGKHRQELTQYSSSSIETNKNTEKQPMWEQYVTSEQKNHKLTEKDLLLEGVS